MSWKYIEKLKKRHNEEINLKEYNNAGASNLFALCYPNAYNVGMANLGFQTIYDKINSFNEFRCERFFTPDKEDSKDFWDIPPLSLESQRNLNQFDIVGFSVSFELDYTNILWFLDKSRIPLLSKDREEHHPLVIGGGPCITFNPMPLSPFFDLFVIGEGEEVIEKIMEIFKGSKDSREQTLKNLSEIEGVFVPSIHLGRNDIKIKKGILNDMDKNPCISNILSSEMEFNDMFLIEISRGCGRNCKFCMAGYCYRKPRIRSVEHIITECRKALTFRQKVGLVGAAISDYPYIDELVTRLKDIGFKISVASLRADSLSEVLVDILAYSNHQTITIAPEGGTERIRKYINKNITEEDILNAAKMAFTAGIPNVRLYFMIGFPGEKIEDIEGIVDITKKIKKLQKEHKYYNKKVTLSINPFVPKPFTPFQWAPMETIKNLDKKVKLLKNQLLSLGGIEIIYESPRDSKIQGFLARGNSQYGRIIMDVYNEGISFGNWKKIAKRYGFNLEEDTEQNRDYYINQPWEILDLGISKEYLIKLMNASLEVLINE